MTGAPPSEVGGLNLMVAEPSPGVAEMMVGLPGTVLPGTVLPGTVAAKVTVRDALSAFRLTGSVIEAVTVSEPGVPSFTNVTVAVPALSVVACSTVPASGPLVTRKVTGAPAAAGVTAAVSAMLPETDAVDTDDRIKEAGGVAAVTVTTPLADAPGIEAVIVTDPGWESPKTAVEQCEDCAGKDSV